MGSYLKGMTKQEWKRDLPRLKTSLDGKIESILKFSYDALSDEDKELFLYIACIFNNEAIEKVEAHLANNFSDVSQGLRILAEKSLISVTGLGEIKMHDLLARFGRDIVRKQSSQFLVDARDICKVLNNNTASCGSVIGAVINISENMKELNKRDSAVESMSCLQFLRLSHNSPPLNVVELPYRWMTWLPSKFNPYRNTTQILKNLPRNVRLLDWQYCPMTFLPSEFNPEFLVELKMRDSKLEELWRGNKKIRNLKWIDLSGSEYLRKLPGLSYATNLHELNLYNCLRLTELPSSIGNAINLQRLNLAGCLFLAKLPSSIGNAINLKKLSLLGCSKLQELPSSIGNAINLTKLNLSHCSSLMELPSSIGNVISLRKLVIQDCEKLVSLPQLPDSLEILDAQHCESLERLHFSFHNTRFVELNFAGCFKLNQEARDLIIKASSCKFAILPGKEVPPHFTYRAIGSSCSMKLNGINTHLPTSLTFKACFLLFNDFGTVDDWRTYAKFTYRIAQKQNSIETRHRLKQHLYIYELEEEVSSSGLVFEVEAHNAGFEIAKCGISILRCLVDQYYKMFS